MTIAKPGTVVLTDNAGTLSGTGNVLVYFTPTGESEVEIVGQCIGLTKDEILGDQVCGKLELYSEYIESATYDNSAHTITIVPVTGFSLYVYVVLDSVTGDIAFTVSTEDGVPEWASDIGTSLVTEPAGAKKTLGFEFEERPPANWFNWFFNLVTRWISWFDTKVDEALASITSIDSRVADLESAEATYDAIVASGDFSGTLPTAKTWTIFYRKYASGLVKLWWDAILSVDSSASFSFAGSQIPDDILTASGDCYFFAPVVLGSLAIDRTTSVKTLALTLTTSVIEVPNGCVEYYVANP